jgi:hypothetical protein
MSTTTATTRLVTRDGRPVMLFNGQPLSQAMYSDPVVDIDPLAHSTPERWLERCRDFRDSGVHVYTLQPAHWVGHHFGESRFWRADGVYPDCSPDDEAYCVDKQALALLEMDPEATFFVRFGDQVPHAWFEANQDQMQLTCDGTRPHQPSFASRKALDDVCVFVRRVVAHCEAQPWADRVAGYLYYPGGEGISLMNCGGHFFDQCPPMQDVFRHWVRDHYADETALRAAWGDDALTFETVRVPTDAEWQAARKATFHWIEGHELQPMRDYVSLQRELFIDWYRTLIRTMVDALSARPVLFGIDMAKVPMIGWNMSLFWNGEGAMDFINMFTASGSIDIGELLDEPGLDLLVTPADYSARSVGYGFEPEGIADSLHLRGKAILTENDCRTFNPGAEDHTLGAFRTPAEVRAGFLRNAAWSLSRGHFDYWMIAGGEYFHHPEVQRAGVQACVPLLDAAPGWPHQETEHAVAMIVDDAGMVYEDGTCGYQHLAVLWQRINGLAHCGIPYRLYLFSDLEKANMPDYRCYLFPNLFHLDDARLAVLRNKVFRDGRMSIFGPATGITDGRALSAEWASRVLGVEMELIRKTAQRRVIIHGDHPIARRLPSSLIYGDSYQYGPILLPAKGALETAGAAMLGSATLYWGANRPGCFLRDAGDYQVAWSAAMPLPAGLLRELAREGGCHVWCEDDDVVLASETVAALHSARSGPRTLTFPTPRPTWDALTGEQLGDAVQQVAMEIQAPDTRIFVRGQA